MRLFAWAVGLCSRWLVLVSVVLLLQACASILNADDGSTYNSLDGRRSAVVQQGSVTVDGRPGTHKYEGILKPGVSFSSDGSRVAYVGVRSGKHYIVVDNEEYGPYDGIATSGLHISPAGKRIAAEVVVGERWRMWVDGTTGRDYDGLMASGPAFSPDEAHIAYGARTGKSWAMVVDGVEQDAVDTILDGGIAFTSAGSAYLGFKSKDGWRVRTGQWTGEAFEALNKPGILTVPQRDSVAYIGRRNGKASVCIDAQCDQPFPLIGTLVNVDSGGFGEGFMQALLWGVVGGVAGGLTGANVPMPFVGSGPSTRLAIYASIVFSPDGRHRAYVAFDTVPKLVIDNVIVADLAAGAQPSWMQFDDSSGVLMYRLANDAALHGVAVPPGTEVPGEFNTPADPVRATVLAALGGFGDRKLLLASKAPPNDVLKLRVLADIPLHDEVLGYAVGDGSGALVFAQSGIYVRNEHSSRDSRSRAYFVPYATLARSPRATAHPAFEVVLTPDVVVQIASMPVSKNSLIEFVETLKLRLAQVIDVPAPAR